VTTRIAIASQPVSYTNPVATQPAIHTAISAVRRRISLRWTTVSGSRMSVTTTARLRRTAPSLYPRLP
jgi:hypothetical protein